MNTSSTRPSLHPVIWAAAVAVILLCGVGIAAITGLIPISKSSETPAIPQPASTTLSDQTPAQAQPPVAPASEEPAPVPQPKAVAKHTHHHKVQIASAESAPAPLAQPSPPPAPSVCHDCGSIESIQKIAQDGQGSGVGAVAGGALGGLLGHNVGNGNGRTIATIAGVVGGAMLGNHVEKTQKQTVSYKTTVRFDDGTSGVFNSPNEQGFHEGERVRAVNGLLQPE